MERRKEGTNKPNGKYYLCNYVRNIKIDRFRIVGHFCRNLLNGRKFIGIKVKAEIISILLHVLWMYRSGDRNERIYDAVMMMMIVVANDGNGVGGGGVVIVGVKTIFVHMPKFV